MTIDEGAASGPSPHRRVYALIGVLLGLAALLAALTPDFFDLSRWNAPLLIALGAGFALSERLIFHVEARNEAISYSPSDLMLGIGIVSLGPLGVVLARLAGVGVAQVAFRRNAPLKLAFNSANFVLETVLAAAIYNRLVHDATRATPSTWAALLLGLFVALLAGGIAVAAVISCFEGGFVERARREVRQSHLFHLPGAAVAAAVATSILADPWLGLIVMSVAPIVWLVVRSHGALQHQYDDLTRAHRFNSEVSDEDDQASMLERGALQIADNLRAESVAVRIWSNGESIEFAAGDHRLLDLLPTDPDDDPPSDLQEDGATVTTSFGDERGRLGFIAIGDRGGVADHFDEAERSRMASMLGQLVVALRKSQLYAQIQYDATHDRLTGLANRSFFEAWLNEVASAAGHYGSVLFIDLDRFKEINDTFGHGAGDQLLEACADRIRHALPEGSLAARFGGDEFAAYIPQHRLEETERVATALTEALDEPFTLDDATVGVTSSIGIVSMPTNGRTAHLLLRRADIAMYDAKRRSARYTVYDDSLDENESMRLSLLADLRHALAADELDVHYQPKIDIATGRIVAAEALVRWTHPERGPIRPDVFVQLAEQSGLIEPLTDAVMRKAVTAAAQWDRRGWDIGVAVNISAQSLLDERLLQMIDVHLATSGLAPDRLMLEITESTMMSDPRRTEAMLNRLTEIGVEVSVDDYGTGYSSLSSLRDLPVAELKIDRGFVSAMDSNHNDAVIVRSTIDLAHNLGLRIVAEGVETVEVLRELGSLDCDLAQGYGISRPLPLLQFNQWIAFRTATNRGPTWQWEESSPLVDWVDQIDSNRAKSSSNATI